MKGGSKPHVYNAAAEKTRPDGKTRPRPPASPSDITEPHWSMIFGCSSRKLSDAAKAARKVWRELLPLLKASGRITTLDASVLEEYCICRARVAACEQEIDDKGLVIEGPRGPVKNPATTIAGQYRTRLKVCEEQLGIGSMNRLRLPPPPPPESNDDDLDAPAD